MIVSRRHKFIFLKTRKVAGSSIEKYLYDYLGPNDVCTGSVEDGTPTLNNNGKTGHRPWYWFKEKIPHEWENFYKFTVTRNPFDSLVSFYYWHKNNNKPLPIASKSFEYFILNADLKKFNDWYKYTDNNIIQVDKVLKFENLHFELLEDKNIPYNSELLRIYTKNKTREIKDYKSLYTQEMKVQVEKEFAKVLDTFNYNF